MVYINVMVDTLKHLIIWPWNLISPKILFMSSAEVIVAVIIQVVVVALIWFIFTCRRIRILNWLDVVLMLAMLVAAYSWIINIR